MKQHEAQAIRVARYQQRYQDRRCADPGLADHIHRTQCEGGPRSQVPGAITGQQLRQMPCVLVEGGLPMSVITSIEECQPSPTLTEEST
jgi:hypothetical protein